MNSNLLFSVESKTPPLECSLLIHSTHYDWLASAKNRGFAGMQTRCSVAGHSQTVHYATVTSDHKMIVARGCAGMLSVESIFDFHRAKRGVVVRHRFINPSENDVQISDIETTQNSSGGVRLDGVHIWDHRFFHTDNLRFEQYPHCLSDYPYVRPIPARRIHLGRGEDSPYPGVGFIDGSYRQGLIVGAASQKTTFQSYEIEKSTGLNSGSFLDFFAVHHEIPQLNAKRLGPGESFEIDGLFLQMLEKTEPQDAWTDHIQHIQEGHVLRGATTSALDQALYCSWNYGRFGDQNEAALLKSAVAIAKSLPNVRFFLMDAGYTKPPRFRSEKIGNQFYDTGGNDWLSSMDSFYSDVEAAIDPVKFPRGLTHYVKEIRNLGLRPGIWLTPQIRLHSQLADEHPDWLLQATDGEVYKIGDLGFLDLNHPEVRIYVDDTLRVLIRDFGFDAVKMDFWSQQFESRAVLRDAARNLSALDARRFLFDTIRKYLPEDGIFMTCVAVSMGNPFLGEWADTYRNSADIGGGTWSEQIHSCNWSLPSIVNYRGRDALLLCADGIGFNPEAPLHENALRLTWGYITMGLMEIDGFIENLSPEHLAMLRRMSDRCDMGHRCRCLDLEAFTGVALPRVLSVDFPAGSVTHKQGVKQSLAFFNWSEDLQCQCIPLSRLGHANHLRAVDFWTGEEVVFSGEFAQVTLAPRSSLLLDVPA